MSNRDRERVRSSRHQQAYDVFDRNSPRPPVPGEERIHCSEWMEMELGKVHRTASPTFKSHCHNADIGLCQSAYCDTSSKPNSRPSSRHDQALALDNPRTPSSDQSSPPACLKWATSLHYLLEDSDGAQLFRKYLQSEGQPYADALDFWFACKGLRKQDEPERVRQLIKAIHKRFFLRSALPFSEEMRKRVLTVIKALPNIDPPVALFDEAQSQIESLINSTTYPNFLKSDMYLQHVQSIQNPSSGSVDFSSESSSSSSSISTKEFMNSAGGAGPLPIIHEDAVFVPTSAPLLHTPGTCMGTGYHTPNFAGPARLTKDNLLVTQKHRAMDVRPKPEAFADKYMYRGQAAHVAYNSYNPVSRQDSEIQSLSSHSDARTESDNLSYTDSSVDGRSVCRSSRRQARQTRDLAALNRETLMHQTVIPRTQQRVIPIPLNPQDFAAVLIEKLENVKRERESQELLDRKLKESDSMSSIDDKVRPRDLANAIREKLQLEDDNDQDILDQHVSRVFSDQTPFRSPGIASPKPHSPTRNRWQSFGRPRRKDKDGVSTFSSDSGNVHDFGDGSEHKFNMVKSKSMPEYAEERFIRSSANRRSSSKKTLTDLTDSGVSVVSDTPSHGLVVKDNRVLAWLKESDKSGRCTSHTLSEMSAKHRNATSPNANRHRKGYGSRSSSLERNNCARPAQPFVADPNMPPLPLPNTAIQLEEARRRLIEDTTVVSRPRTSHKHFTDISQSRDSTLRKSLRVPKTLAMPPPFPVTESTTVAVVSFCDEQFPYRFKIPGNQVTLRQFKDVLPKKGTYRYFFKTVCEELNNQVIQEEISNDTEVLPLLEGKIMAKVQAID